MSVVRRSLTGEQVRGLRDAVGLRYCTDEQLRRATAIEMLRLKEAGLPTQKIAMKYRISPRYVNMLVRQAREHRGYFDRAREESVA